MDSAIQEPDPLLDRPLGVVDELSPERVKQGLQEQGAVCVRLDGATVADFESLTRELMAPMVHHATSTIERDAVNTDATISTVNKGSDAVPLHREGSYAPRCPDLLAFYCVQPAAEAGETTFCDGVRLRESLSVKVRELADSTTLRWTWTAPRERWQAMLAATAPDQATAKLSHMAAALSPREKLAFRFEGDTLHGAFETPCVISTRWGGRQAFCNSLLIYHFRQKSEYFAKDLLQVTTADGTPLPADLLAEASARAQSLTTGVAWQPGDMLILDNSRYMHGRNAFQDPNRRVLIRMGHVRADW